MALKDLTDGDFQYYKRYAHSMMDCHEKEFVRVIDPDLMRALYRGKSDKKRENTDDSGYWNDKAHYMALSKIFQATNTILPNLYYKNPTPIVVPKRDSDPNSAALMTAILKHYMKLNKAKEQNQEAVLNAYFFGLGWKKIGYRTVFLPKTNEPESIPDQSMFDKIRGGFQKFMGMEETPKPDNTMSRETPDLVDYETLFNDSESPMNIMLDHKADLANKKCILHRLPRTLHDLEVSGDYEEAILKEIFDLMKHQNGSRFDSREIDLHLNELHILQKNGVWILTWIDEFGKALKYDKSDSKVSGFLFSPLILTNEPGVRYPVSHLRVAGQGQIKLNDLASLYVELIARSRNMLAVNRKALSAGQYEALEQNLIQGILSFDRDITPGVFQDIKSSPVSNDLPNLMNIIQQNITEVMGSDEQMVSGNSKNDTLGQDELARVGTKIRESGMLDRVQDWMVDQLRKEGTLIKQYSNAELNLVITGKDYSDPVTGERVEDKWVEFMTENNPLGAKHYLQGEFDYDINVEEALRPNKQLQQQQYLKLIELTPTIQQSLMPNARFRTDLLIKAMLGTFEGIPSPELLVESIDPRQAAAIQASEFLMSGKSGIQMTPDVAGEEPKGDVSNKSSEAAKL